METAGRIGATLVIATAILALPAEARGDDPVAALLALVGADAHEEARLADGTVSKLGEAVAGRVGPAGGDPPDPPSVKGAGDVWVLERGAGPCERHEIAPQPISLPLHPRNSVHAGYVGEFRTTHGHATSIFSWTTGAATTRTNTQGFTAVGSVDPWCVDTAEGHFALPFVNGVVWFN